MAILSLCAAKPESPTTQVEKSVVVKVAPDRVRTLGGLNRRLWGVAFSPDGEKVACGGVDRRLHVFGSESGLELLQPLGHDATIFAVAFNHDGTRVASAGAAKLEEVHGVRLIPAQVEKVGGVDLLVAPLCFIDPNEGGRPWFGNADAIVSLVAKQGVLKVWDSTTGQCIRTWNGLKEPACAVGFSSDGSEIGVLDQAYGLKILHINTGIPRIDLNQQGLTRQGGGWGHSVLSFSHAPVRLASTAIAKGQGRLLIRLWDWDADGPRFREIDPPGPSNPWVIALNQGGKRFVTGDIMNDSITLWDFEKAVVLKTFEVRAVEPRGTYFLAFSPDGSRIVSGNRDGLIRVWDSRSGRLLRTKQAPAKPIRAVVFRAKGLRVAAGGYYEHTEGMGPAREVSVDPLLIWDLPFDDPARMP